MKIIVLAGGLSTERDVSLSSGAGICRTLREKGHDAFLLDPFLGLPDAGDDVQHLVEDPAADAEGQGEAVGGGAAGQAQSSQSSSPSSSSFQ